MYNINSSEFANGIGVSEATVRQWQTGRNFPSKGVQDNLYSTLQTIVNKLTTPTLSAQMAKYISELIPFTTDLFVRSKDNSGDVIVSVLKLCYSNGKMGNSGFYTSINPFSTSGKTQAVVFDFDGTLTESYTTKTTWESIWIELGYDVEECRALHRRFDSKEITHEEWCSLTTEKFLQKGLRSESITKIASRIQLIDGCEETFKQLKAHNIKIYIVSGSILPIMQNVW